jgi:iron complex outermembrane recepter protein
MRFCALAWAVMGCCHAIGVAAAEELPSVLVESPYPHPSLPLDEDSLAFHRITDVDVAQLLPGTDVARAGAAAGLPVLRGLGDDRVRTLVDGVPLTAACPMHMNPPLSYLSPSQVQTAVVLPGVTPVSLGGDSIAGTISVRSADPAFAVDNTALLFSGAATSIFRSNGSGIELAANAAVANDRMSLGYAGSGVRTGDYEDGRGERVRASRLKKSDQQITFALRDETNLIEIKAGYQDIPYQGFPNADMDLAGNHAESLNLLYRGVLGRGRLQASAYFANVRHDMNGDAPDRYPPSPIDITSMGDMPQQERGQDFGYRLEYEIAASSRDTFRVGSEFHGQKLDDRWPGAPMGMMFDYVNLNHATRQVLGTFIEWQRSLDAHWNLLAGLRNDSVWMRAGAVQGYAGIDSDAQAFNAGSRSHTDFNLDATLLARFRPDDVQTYDFGLSRKTRSPNLYERYAWGMMTIGMISWFGDGNGYTGDPSLKPEVAYSASAAASWHDANAGRWQLDVSTYYTHIDHYIGVESLCDPQCSASPAAQLMFANHESRLYGVDAAASYRLLDSERAGVIQLRGAIDEVRGTDTTEHTALYRLMPFNAALTLDHRLRNWQSRLELRAVSAKRQVEAMRLEPQTAGYAIATIRTAYEWKSLRLDAAITNLFDRQYGDPLGGRWQSGLYPPSFSGSIPALPGVGRSIDIGITVKL